MSFPSLSVFTKSIGLPSSLRNTESVTKIVQLSISLMGDMRDSRSLQNVDDSFGFEKIMFS